jgi:hypothetical protein
VYINKHEFPQACKVRHYNTVCMCWCRRILQSESEALSSDDSVVLNLPALLDVRLGEAVQLRCGSAAMSHKV